MLWWVGITTAGIAALQFFGTGSVLLGWISVIVAIGGFWTAGIATNFGKGEEQTIPDSAAGINTLTAIGGVILLIVSFM